MAVYLHRFVGHDLIDSDETRRKFEDEGGLRVGVLEGFPRVAKLW